ncbi:MAG: hypothetical protein Q7S29_03615 [Candidatus Peribacter sp.]|nr:hypothetical protein [Candidatus Peribacter sp.]
MQALDELPDGDGESLPSGNCKIRVQEMRTFMSDLHETIVAQILEGRTSVFEIIDGEEVEFVLPKLQQLYDFVSFHQELHEAIGVLLMMPSKNPRPNGEYIYRTEYFQYKPPEPLDTSYLPAFSQN